MSDSDSAIKNQLDTICKEFQDNWSYDQASDFAHVLSRVDEKYREQLSIRLREIDIRLRRNKSLTNLPSDSRIESYLDAIEEGLASGQRLDPEDVCQDPQLLPILKEKFRKLFKIDRLMQLGSAPTDSPMSPKGEFTTQDIGPYKLLQQIGEGGMGTVWMAEQYHPVRRRVALKVIKPGMDSKQVLARFEAERQALAMMDHQHIAKVLDVGMTTDGRPYFAMELVKGIPLTQYCDRNKLSPEERLELFIPVCQAIQHAHQKGIIHRDIKPSNVLVTLYDGKPVPKVIDFGLAKALQQEIKLTDKTMFTQFGQVVGTLQYMSPEQAEMNALDVDTRTDIYSLGVMLYELLTGSTPLDAKTIAKSAHFKVLELIREQEPPRPSTRISESGDAITGISAQRKIGPSRLQQMLRGELDWIVMKALDKDRTRRYETASSFADDVQRFLDDDAVVARPPSAAYRLKKFVSRHRGAVASIGLVILLLIVAVTGTTIGMYRAWIARGEAVLAKNIADEEKQNAETERNRALEAMQLATQQTQTLLAALENAAGKNNEGLVPGAQLFHAALVGVESAAKQLEFRVQEGLADRAELVVMADRIRRLAGPPLSAEGISRARQLSEGLYQTVIGIETRSPLPESGQTSKSLNLRIDSERGLALLVMNSDDSNEEKSKRVKPHLDSILKLSKKASDFSNAQLSQKFDYLSELDQVADYYLKLRDQNEEVQLRMEGLDLCRKLVKMGLSSQQRGRIIDRCTMVTKNKTLPQESTLAHARFISDYIANMPKLEVLKTFEIRAAFDSALMATRQFRERNNLYSQVTYLGHAMIFHSALLERYNVKEESKKLSTEINFIENRFPEESDSRFAKEASERLVTLVERQGDDSIVDSRVVDFIKRQYPYSHWRQYLCSDRYLRSGDYGSLNLLCHFYPSPESFAYFWNKNDLRKEIEAWTKALESNSEKVVPKIILVGLLHAEALSDGRVSVPRHQQIVTILSELSETHPDFVGFFRCLIDANHDLGVARAKRGALTDAVQNFGMAVKLSEKKTANSDWRNANSDVDATLNLAGCLVLADQLEEAEGHLKRILKDQKTSRNNSSLARANAIRGIGLSFQGKQDEADVAIQIAFAILGKKLQHENASENISSLASEIEHMKMEGYFCDLVFERFATEHLFDQLAEGISQNEKCNPLEKKMALIELYSVFVNGAMKVDNEALVDYFTQQTIEHVSTRVETLVTSLVQDRKGNLVYSLPAGDFVGCHFALGLNCLQQKDFSRAIGLFQKLEAFFQKTGEFERYSGRVTWSEFGLSLDYPTAVGLRCFAELQQHGQIKKALAKLDFFRNAFNPTEDQQARYRYDSETGVFVKQLLKARKFREAQQVIIHFFATSAGNELNEVECLYVLGKISSEFKPTSGKLDTSEKGFWSTLETEYLRMLQAVLVKSNKFDLFVGAGKFYTAGKFNLINRDELGPVVRMMEQLVDRQSSVKVLSVYFYYESQLALAALLIRQARFDQANRILMDFLDGFGNEPSYLAPHAEQFEIVLNSLSEQWQKAISLQAARMKMETALLAKIRNLQNGLKGKYYSPRDDYEVQSALVELYRRWNMPKKASRWENTDPDQRPKFSLFLGRPSRHLGNDLLHGIQHYLTQGPNIANLVNQRVWDLVKGIKQPKKLDKIKSAFRQIQSLGELFPRPEYLRTLIVAEFRLGKYRDSIESVKKSIEVQKLHIGPNLPNKIIGSGVESTIPGPIEMAILAMSYELIGEKNKADSAQKALNEFITLDSFEADKDEESFIQEFNDFFESRSRASKD